MSLEGCQINPINVNFHFQKSLEIFETNSDDKIQSQNFKEGKSALPHANKDWYEIEDFFFINFLL